MLATFSYLFNNFERNGMCMCKALHLSVISPTGTSTKYHVECVFFKDSICDVKKATNGKLDGQYA